tara:strand:+ start:448 stop:576 length:129 start_codon:yes stop_codon:yes gene_type:complete
LPPTIGEKVYTTINHEKDSETEQAEDKKAPKKGSLADRVKDL